MHHTCPLLRPFACYICGIAASYFTHCRLEAAPFPLQWLAVPPLLLLSMQFLVHYNITYRKRFRFGMLMAPLFFILGWGAVQCAFQRRGQCLSQCGANGPETFRAVVCEPPSVRERSVRLTVGLSSVFREDGAWQPDGKCLLSLERDSVSESLAYGDVILFRAELEPPAGPRNEGEFHYDRYLFRKGIYLQAWIPADGWVRTVRQEGSPLLRIANRCHSRLFTLIAESSLCAEAKGMVSTMLLGDDAMLDPEVSDAFATAGVSHILCVSGMHVGILYLMTGYLLFFLNRTRRLRQLKTLLNLAVIWGYACLVALTPSVVRASVMFSFVSIGSFFRRQTPIYNSLLTSAFLMLLLRPLLLFETGFLLSYLAVWGIVCTQPMLQRLWEPRRRVLRYLRDVWAVSLAAQLFTGPLSVFCFHRFPLYFLLSNVVVVFLAPWVIGAAMLFLAVSFHPLASWWAARLLDWLVWLMHGGVAAVGRLPGASLGPLAMDGVQLALIYLLLAFTLLWLQRKNVRLLGMALCCLLLYLGDGIGRAVANRSCRELALYAIPHHYAVEYGDARSTMVFTDAPELLQEGRFDFFMQGSRLRHGRSLEGDALRDSLSGCWVKSGGYFQFGSCSFFCPEGPFRTDSASVPLPFPDYLLVGDSTLVRPEKLLSTIAPGCVCTLPGIPPSRAGRWRRACEERGIPFVEMGKSGMLRLCIDRQ